MGVLRLVSIIWANEVCTFVKENVGSHFLNWHEFREEVEVDLCIKVFPPNFEFFESPFIFVL